MINNTSIWIKISNKEIVVGCSKVIEIYEIDENSFGLDKQALKLIISKPITDYPEFFSITHDEMNRKIIFSNVYDSSITVWSQDQEHLDGISGTCLDVNTGELFVCFSKGVSIFKLSDYFPIWISIQIYYPALIAPTMVDKIF